MSAEDCCNREVGGLSAMVILLREVDLDFQNFRVTAGTSAITRKY